MLVVCTVLLFCLNNNMKETYYFSHDYNARGDEKIVRLLAKEGWEGYGLFWAIIEKLYEADGWIDEDYECIAFDLRTDSERINRIVNNYNLFVVGKQKICSNSVLARLRKRKGKSEQARQSANLRWNKRNKSDANALRTQSEGNAIKERKGKENKGKENTIALSDDNAGSIKEVMNIFYEINPTLNYGNKTYRSSAQWLIDKYGVEKVTSAARYAVSIQGEQFAPQILNPYQLKEKLTALTLYKQKSEPKDLLVIG